MQTLEEFLKDKELPIRLSAVGVMPKWVEFRYKFGYSFYGHDNAGNASAYTKDCARNWYVWEEPVKLVPWYQWVYRVKGTSEYRKTNYYKTQEDCFKNWDDANLDTRFRDDESMRMWPES